MIRLRDILSEAKLLKFNGAGGKRGRVQMCHLNSRKYYWKLRNAGKNVQYMEGEVYTEMEIKGDWKWINHAWNVVNGKLFDCTYGKNDKIYRGYVVKDDYMNKIPKWMASFADVGDYDDINIRVGDEFGKRAYK